MTAARRIYHLWPRGGLGNQMIEFMAALSLRERLTGIDISNISLAPWNIAHPSLPATRVRTLAEDDLIDVGAVRGAFDAGFDCVAYSGYAQHTDNLLDADYYRKFFRSDVRYGGWSDRHLVINIRGAEILDARHSAYGLLPVSFYEEVVETSGLTPVFMGQIDDNCYMDAIRARFRGATFAPSLGPVGDFQSLRHSQHVVPSISTFSWLACWLSEATVHFPIVGLFNPFQEVGKRFVPDGAARYHLYQFPIYYSQPVESYQVSHASLDGNWYDVSADMVETCLRQYPRFPVGLDAMKRVFDPAYYLDANPDVAEHFGTADGAALSHFCQHGFHENRPPLDVDERFYVAAYPLAAREIGSGDFRNAVHHYASVGRLRGYRPRAANGVDIPPSRRAAPPGR